MQILGPAQELVAQNLQGIFNNKALGGCGLPNISELSLNPLGELGEKREPGLTQGCQVGGVIPFAVSKSLSRVLGRIQDLLSLQGGPSWRWRPPPDGVPRRVPPLSEPVLPPALKIPGFWDSTALIP